MRNAKGQFIKGSTPKNKGIKTTKLNCICLICKKRFHLCVSHKKRGGIYCSNKCRGISQTGRAWMTEENNPAWKGNKVGYSALHNWVYRKLGKASKCDNNSCIYPRRDTRGKMMLTPKKYEWANISGEYKRDISDWIQLCTSCHNYYDRGNLML